MKKVGQLFNKSWATMLNRRSPFLFVLLALFLVSCSHEAVLPPHSNFQQVPISALHPQREPKPLSTVDMPPEASPTVIKIPKKEKLYNINVVNAVLRDVLRLIVQEAGLNLVMDKDVNQETLVSLKLTDSDLKTTLDYLLKPLGYSYTIKGDTLLVSATITKVFHFNYMVGSRTASEESGGDVLGGISDSGGSSSSSGSSGGGGSTEMKGKFEIKSEDKEDEMDVWKQIEDGIAQLKSPSGNVVINRVSGTIMVTDKVENVELIGKFLDTVKSSLERQILIEAKILEVTLSSGSSMGIDWNHVFDGRHLFGKVLKEGSTISLGQTLAPSLSSGLMVSITSETFNALLRALATQGQIKVLSSPRLSIMNGQNALISVGDEIPYIDISDVERDTDTNTVTVDYEVKRVHIGVLMGVTPFIDKQNKIVMRIVPIITHLLGEKDLQLPDGGTFPNPVIDVRQMSTVVKVNNGETLVLGGLITEKGSLRKEKIPFVGDVPGAGNLFAKRFDTNKRTELVILLTPHIL